MRIVVTGGDGFIGRNLRVRLREVGYTDVTSITRATSVASVRTALAEADFVFHLAGVNRPKEVSEFGQGNAGVTETLCAALAAGGRRTPVVYASSIQAALDNPYGRSKRSGEQALEGYGQATGAPVFVLRLPNVFGKWCRPNYNSVVATFCHNIARGLPITIHDPDAELRLVYVDDVVAGMIHLLDPAEARSGFVDVGPTYATTVGEVSAILQVFPESRRTLVMPPVGMGLHRALYATYLSYLSPADFAYDLKRHTDPRGVFVEMLKTPESGQVSYFTAPPGVTRGEHYHHTKAEKFLVVMGTARFGFRHIMTDERHELIIDSDAARVVETVPGWAHNITNIGSDEMVVMLWASECFDPQQPDTIPSKVDE